MDKEKEKAAIDRLRAFVPSDGKPYYLCYSGGKDSDCIRILADLAGVPHTIEHNLTTVDAPETVRYIKSIPGVHINRPEKTMWQLIEIAGPPTRINRFCCEKIKERKGNGRIMVTGVRWAESYNRSQNRGMIDIVSKPKQAEKVAKNEGANYQLNGKGGLTLNMDNAETRRTVENCFRTSSVLLNPIIDWEETDVWEFLHHYGCKSNPLYAEGCKRIGCIGCPMQGGKGMKEDFVRYPKYRQAYLHAFERMLRRREELGKVNPEAWGKATAEDVMK